MGAEKQALSQVDEIVTVESLLEDITRRLERLERNLVDYQDKVRSVLVEK